MYDKPVKIAILASGTGSNAQLLFKKFPVNDNHIATKLLVCNNKKAGVIEKGEKNNIPTVIILNKEVESDKLYNYLLEYDIDYIILAGFLRKIPKQLVSSFRNKIINIHPSLLPKYGGKGMYGDNVHKAVLENKEKKSGISIHLVNEEYDKGALIFQKICDISDNETVQSLAIKIHAVEHKYFGEIIKQYIEKHNENQE